MPLSILNLPFLFKLRRINPRAEDVAAVSSMTLSDRSDLKNHAIRDRCHTARHVVQTHDVPATLSTGRGAHVTVLRSAVSERRGRDWPKGGRGCGGGAQRLRVRRRAPPSCFLAERPTQRRRRWRRRRQRQRQQTVVVRCAHGSIWRVNCTSHKTVWYASSYRNSCTFRSR